MAFDLTARPVPVDAIGASLALNVPPSSGTIGSVSLMWEGTVQNAPVPSEDVEKSLVDTTDSGGGDAGAQPIAVRRGLRRMTEAQQQRFVAALKKTMEGPPDESEYFRIAGYHGWPGDYCHHGREVFPVSRLLLWLLSVPANILCSYATPI